MFSGIIERQGKLIRKERQGKHIALTFETQGWEKPLKRGESISVNGVCLTVIRSSTKNQFKVQAVPETLAQTTIGDLCLKETVNLERSLKWGERIGGHFVLGHIDGVGRILRKISHGKSFALQIDAPPRVMENIVPKGSIAVDGASLTIQKISGRSITVAIIPHTAKRTTIGSKNRGDFVNLEADVIAKHLTVLIQNAESKAAMKL